MRVGPNSKYDLFRGHVRLTARENGPRRGLPPHSGGGGESGLVETLGPGQPNRAADRMIVSLVLGIFRSYDVAVEPHRLIAVV